MLFRFIWQANLGNALGAFSRAPNSRWTPCTVQIWSNHLPKFWSLCLHPLNCSIFPRLKRCLEPTYLLLIGLVVMFIVEHSSNGCDGSKGTGLRVFLVEKYPWIACLSPIILFCLLSLQMLQQVYWWRAPLFVNAKLVLNATSIRRQRFVNFPYFSQHFMGGSVFKMFVVSLWVQRSN